MDDNFIPFNGERELGQNQYASRFIDGRLDSANLGAGLRFSGDPSDYHFVRIHKDDHAEFHRRVKHYMKLTSEGRRDEADAYARKVTKRFRLRDVVPHEFFAEFRNTRAATMLDVEVEQVYGLGDDEVWKSWPGPEKNVLNWWKLVDGRCVGWNENPARGWSFPVHGRKAKP